MVLEHCARVRAEALADRGRGPQAQRARRGVRRARNAARAAQQDHLTSACEEGGGTRRRHHLEARGRQRRPRKREGAPLHGLAALWGRRRWKQSAQPAHTGHLPGPQQKCEPRSAKPSQLVQHPRVQPSRRLGAGAAASSRPQRPPRSPPRKPRATGTSWPPEAKRRRRA